MGNHFKISQPMTAFLIMKLSVFMKIKPAIFGSVLVEAQAVIMGNHFKITLYKEILSLKIEQEKLFQIFHVVLMELVLLLKTKRASFGLVQMAMPSFMMLACRTGREKYLQL